MNRLLPFFILFGFVSIAVFGFVAMGHDGRAGHAGCIATTAAGTDCPATGNFLEALFFHTNAFRSFSTAILATVVLGAIFFALFSYRLKKKRDTLTERSLTLPFSRQPIAQPAFRLKERLFAWLALHENSPAFAKATAGKPAFLR